MKSIPLIAAGLLMLGWQATDAITVGPYQPTVAPAERIEVGGVFGIKDACTAVTEAVEDLRAGKLKVEVKLVDEAVRASATSDAALSNDCHGDCSVCPNVGRCTVEAVVLPPDREPPQRATDAPVCAGGNCTVPPATRTVTRSTCTPTRTYTRRGLFGRWRRCR